MASVETTITSVLDIFPILKKKKLTKVLTIVSICLIYFILGITFTLQSGTFWIGTNRKFNLNTTFINFVFEINI